MNLLHDDTNDLEGELRAMLRRRTGDLSTNQPDWTDLVERSEAVVFSLHSSDDASADDSPAAVGSRLLRKGRASASSGVVRYRPRPVFVAAAVVAVVLAGGLAVGQTRKADPTNVNEAPTSFTAAAPTDAAFDATQAPAVWASGLGDPVAAVQAYLAATGVAPELGTDGLPLPDTGGVLPTVTLLENDGTVAVVEWEALDAGVTRSGTVFLRADAVEQAGSTATSTWGVVGAAVDGIAVTDIAYDGQQLSFSLTKTLDVAGPVAVSVWSDGRQVAVDGGDVVRAGATSQDGVAAGAAAAGDRAQAGAGADDQAAMAGASAGQAVDPALVHVIDLGEGADVDVPLTAALPDASNAVVRVQQLVDGQPASITELALDLPGTETDADADAGVAGTGPGAGAGADAGAESQLPGEVGDVVDGVGDTADELLDGDGNPLPGGPGLPTPSVPTTLLPPEIPTTLPSLPPPPPGVDLP
jgi:hypothetical protein